MTPRLEAGFAKIIAASRETWARLVIPRPDYDLFALEVVGHASAIRAVFLGGLHVEPNELIPPGFAIAFDVAGNVAGLIDYRPEEEVVAHAVKIADRWEKERRDRFN